MASEHERTGNARMKEDTLRHEFRAGAVFYGGVSLAVYENGVARAFFDAATNAGTFAPLLDLIDTRFVVDVVSGSSAGGINGLLLAAALERGYPFRETSELWRQHGGIEDLLRPADEAEPSSLLRGNTYYLTQLRSAFRKICLYDTPDGYEPPQEVDVFVTGTDLAGGECSFVDAFGKDVPTRTHRLVFHMQHRHGRKDLGYIAREQGELSERASASTPEERALQADILASVARVTSSFPGAFPPFTVREFDDNAPEVPELPRTGERVRHALGRLCGRDLSHDPQLIDGGVLDNRPFGPLLEAVFHRMPSPEMRSVTRRVFYIDPDPDVLQRNEAAELSPLSVAVSSVVALPSYDSITADLNHVMTHNARMAHLKRIRERLITMPHQSSSPDSPLYRYALERELMGSLNGAQLPSPQDPDGQEQDELTNRVQSAAALRSLSIGYHLRRASSLFYGYKSSGGTPAVELRDRAKNPYQVGRVVKALKLLRDVWASELTRTKQWVDAQAKNPREGGPRWPTITERLQLLEHYIGGSWTRRAAGVRLANYELTPDDLSSNSLSELAHEARRELRRYLPQPSDGAAAAHAPQALPATPPGLDTSGASFGLLGLLERYLIRLLGGASELDDFAKQDCSLYPLELASGTHELDEVKLVRISPEDPELSKRICGRDKVAGDELAHFSAFLRRDFRTNDVAWGHVDGIDRIARALLDDDARLRAARRLQGSAHAFSLQALTQGADLAGVSESLRSSVVAELERLSSAFSDCLAEGAELSRTTWTDFINAFITATQTRAASEYIELIVKDASDQDRAFNWADCPPLRNPPGSALSQLIELRRGAAPILATLPPSIVVEYGARAGLLLWGMVEKSLPKSLTRARPFVVGVLSIVHASATLIRREQRVVQSFLVATLAASLAFIVATGFGASIKLFGLGLIGLAFCVLLAASVRSLRWLAAATIAATFLALGAGIWVLAESSISFTLPWSETSYTHNYPRSYERQAAPGPGQDRLLSTAAP